MFSVCPEESVVSCSSTRSGSPLELMETFAFCMGKLFRMLITWICKLPLDIKSCPFAIKNAFFLYRRFQYMRRHFYFMTAFLSVFFKSQIHGLSDNF